MPHPNKCDDFGTTDIRDVGQCAPDPVKRDCNVVPQVPISDDPNAFLEVDLEAVPPYRLIASILDENNIPITDTNDEPILGPTL